MAEKKKKRVTIGYKKLKNVDSFDQFDINKEELQGGVNENDLNEANSKFYEDLQDIALSVNVIHYLTDEGYMNDNGSLKADVSDAVDAVEKEMGMDMKEVWDSEGAFDAWIQMFMDDIRAFGNKY